MEFLNIPHSKPAPSMVQIKWNEDKVIKKIQALMKSDFNPTIKLLILKITNPWHELFNNSPKIF